MDLTDPLTWKGLIFTITAFLLLFGMIWWLFLSPLRSNRVSVYHPSIHLINGIVSTLVASASFIVVGALWDASMHIQTGEVPGGSDFLWPPHILLYSGFLLSFIVGSIAVASIALNSWKMGERDPRAWVRSSPYLGMVVLSSAFTMVSIPGDAIWHELIGIDLTAWSPPHVMLAMSSSIILVSAIGVFLQQPFDRRTYGIRNLVIYVLLGLMLNILYLIGVLEWELPGPRNPYVEARPIWLYPFIGGVVAFFAIILAKRLTKARFAGTSVAIAFYVIRLAVSSGLYLSGNVAPLFPLPFILGAFLVDLVQWDQIRSAWLRSIGMSVAYTLGYVFLAFPILSDRTDLPTFSTTDVVMTLVMTVVGTALFVPVTRYTGRRLAGRQPVH